MSFLDLLEFEDEPAKVGTIAHGDDVKWGVKYVDDENKRNKYRVVTDDQGLLNWGKSYHEEKKSGGRGRSGELVDSEEIVQYYWDKWHEKNRNAGGFQLRAAGAFATPDMSKADRDKWGRGLIWVISPEGEIYSNISKPHRFHHSTFLSGGDVMSAGMWIVAKGTVTDMAPLSGHYKPSLRQFLKGVHFMGRAVWTWKPNLALYDKQGKEFRSVPFHDWSTLSLDQLSNAYQSHGETLAPSVRGRALLSPPGSDGPLNLRPAGGHGALNLRPAGGDGALNQRPAGGDGALNQRPTGGYIVGVAPGLKLDGW